MGRILDLVRAADPSATALLAPGRRAVTYRELVETVERLATGLADAGVAGRIALALPNGPELAALLLAATECGSAAPLNPKLLPQETGVAAGQLGVGAMVVPAGASFAAGGVRVFEVAGSWPEIALLETAPGPAARAALSGDEALVLQTSGTTGTPKTVPLSHGQLIASARNIAASLAVTPADRTLALMPLFHIHGIVASLLATLASGGSVACPPPFDAFRVSEWVAELSPTWYSAVPTVHQAILQRRAVGPSHRLRFVRSSSAAMPDSVREGVEAMLGVPLVEAYGMTEAAHQIACNPLPPGIRKPGSVGRPTGVEVRVVDESGDAQPGGRGEVWLRGPTIIDRYDADDAVNAASFTEGWLRTGDQGYFDPDGYLFLTGRLKELINRGGEKISPFEVEEALLKCPGVAEAVAFALPHASLGEEVAAAVVAAPGASVDEATVRAFARATLSAFKVPRRVVVVDAIPLGPTGKLQRSAMAALLGLGGNG
ncbi:MAG: AMP-binding protein [Dehalococcoidia bacterium]